MGCPPAEKKARLGMSDSVFVHSMIELRKVAGDTTMDQMMRDSMRTMILQRYKLTPAQLDTAARALAAQPARAESLWKLIDAGVGVR
jgi:hypothetical protein